MGEVLLRTRGEGWPDRKSIWDVLPHDYESRPRVTRECRRGTSSLVSGWVTEEPLGVGRTSGPSVREDVAPVSFLSALDSVYTTLSWQPYGK